MHLDGFTGVFDISLSDPLTSEMPHNVMKKTLIPVVLSVACLLLGLVAGCRTQTIHEAALSGNLAGVERQLNRGTDINAKDPDGWTPLMLAAQKGKLKTDNRRRWGALAVDCRNRDACRATHNRPRHDSLSADRWVYADNSLGH